MHRFLPPVLLGVLLIAAPTTVEAQVTGAPSTLPAGARPELQTIEVRIGADGGVVAARMPLETREEVRWSVRPMEGIRILGPVEGTRAAGGDGMIDLTFALPRSQPAGRTRIAEVHLRTGGALRIVELVSVVPARRALEVALELPDSARPGDAVAGSYRVRNGGTAVDTVSLSLEADRGWSVEGVPARVELQPGASHEGTFRLRVPADAQLWASTSLRLMARGSGATAFAGRQLSTVNGGGFASRFSILPASVFLGAVAADAGSPRNGRSSAGIAAYGEVFPGVRVDLLAQNDEVGPGSVAMAGIRSSAVLRASLQSARWSLVAGDATATTGLLPRFYAAGRGLGGSWRGRRTDLSAGILLPRLGWGVDRSAEVRTAGAGVLTSLGRFGVAMLDTRRNDGTGESSGRSTALQYRIQTGGHTLNAEGGWLESRSPEGTLQGGAAGEASYRFDGETASISARLRRAPETPLLGAGIRSESSMDGTLPLGGGVSAHAHLLSYRTTEADFLFFNEMGEQRVRVGPSTRGAGTGLEWTDRVRSAGVSGQVLRRETAGRIDTRRTVTLQAGQGFGPLGLHAAAEVGARLPYEGESMDVRRLRGTASWTSGHGSLWASAENSSEGPPLAVAMNGSLRVGAVELSAMMNTFRDSLALPATSFSSSASVAVARGTTLYAGTEYRPWARDQVSPWAVGVGVRRSFGVPLPIADRTVRTGLVFEDLNGNGVHDEGEPGIPAVSLFVGSTLVTTDGQGRFRYTGAPGSEIAVSHRSLASGTMVRPGFASGGASPVQIPVIRTGDLHLRVSLDEGSVGRSSPGAGLTVRLRESNGRVREGVTDDSGLVVFAALVPGPAVASVEGPAPRSGATGEATTVEIGVRPGAIVETSITIMFRPRDVRFSGGDGGS